MNTVFPVELQACGKNGEAAGASLQGFTRDVSASGMCIELKILAAETGETALRPEAALELSINPPFSSQPIRARAKIVWLKKQETPLPARYLIGVAYTEIDAAGRSRLIRYAKNLLWVPRSAAVVGALMLFSLVGLFIHQQSLVRENKKLVDLLVESAQKKSAVVNELEDLRQRKELIERELKASIASLSAETLHQKKAFEDQLDQNRRRQKEITDELERIGEGSRAAHEQMYQWLRSHRNLKTGLVASFEGDPALANQAFTYDQSLACQTFLLFGDVKDAEALLSFYETRAQKADGAFFNAYDAFDGRPVENTVHTGPNIWIGIAALQYQHRVGDGRFLGLTKSVGDWVLAMQDPEGGLHGGPNATWYSTEHNLDAYAFLRMLHDETGEARYAAARDKALDWIKKYAYSNQERRLKRGKGDSTIATDTFSWAIAAIGPERLKQIDFDPEAIMDFAEKNCEVTVQYLQPNGEQASATGFDFAKAENIGRGGVISTEWTAQMVVSYKVLAKYFKRAGDVEKARRYSERSDLYLNELQKLIITSPSRTGQGRGCLPYASIDNVDTGHGWRTPKGARTGSVAGTAYGLFAWTGHNPFQLTDDAAF